MSSDGTLLKFYASGMRRSGTEPFCHDDIEIFSDATFGGGLFCQRCS
jgi:hypothetical protein